jgi:hypothetical protein
MASGIHTKLRSNLSWVIRKSARGAPLRMTEKLNSTVIVRRRWNDPQSHEIQLCVFEGDNSAELNAQVRAMLRR